MSLFHLAKPERQKQDIPNELLGGLVERVTFHNEGSGMNSPSAKPLTRL